MQRLLWDELNARFRGMNSRMLHRSLALFIVVLCLVQSGKANPLMMTHPAYIASEELNVILTADAALIDGKFRFQPDNNKDTPGGRSPVRVMIPLWFPAKSSQVDQTTAPLLDAVARGDLHENPGRFRDAWKNATGFKFTIANREVSVSDFSVYAPTTRHARKSMPPYWQHDGWIVICASVYFSPEQLHGLPEVRIRYRQPLRKTKAGAEFLYVPEFHYMPEGANTANLQRYAMALKSDTGVSASLGSVPIPSGHSARLPLSHHQAIKVMVSVP